MPVGGCGGRGHLYTSHNWLDSKQYLETLLQESVDVFAYPNGRPELDYGVEFALFPVELTPKVSKSVASNDNFTKILSLILFLRPTP